MGTKSVIMPEKSMSARKLVGGLRLTRPLVKKMLSRPEMFDWTIQGFGMVRAQFGSGEAGDDDLRLNIWHRRFRTPDVSDIHTHPWDFSSEVLAGRLYNVVYKTHTKSATLYTSQKLIPGPNGGLLSTPRDIGLAQDRIMTLDRGDTYFQDRRCIHQSNWEQDGTVTVNRRIRVGADEAWVFWPKGGEWVTAKPRTAKEAEVEMALADVWRIW